MEPSPFVEEEERGQEGAKKKLGSRNLEDPRWRRTIRTRRSCWRGGLKTEFRGLFHSTLAKSARCRDRNVALPKSGKG